MSSFASISVSQLSRLVGTPDAPMLFDVRRADDFRIAPYLIPGSYNGPPTSIVERRDDQSVVVICKDGGTQSEGVAANLRSCGLEAEILEGGFEGWRRAGFPVLTPSVMPPRDAKGRTNWVTRSRPKIDRIACPWLIRRFIDPKAVFLYVSASRVEDVAKEFGVTPFDVEGVFWSHRADFCTFDVMIDEFGIATPPLLRLAQMVRAADAARLDLCPEAPGLLAISLGLSRMFSDDLEQLEAGMKVYDALYRWCRDATDEAHNWPSHKAKAKA